MDDDYTWDELDGLELNGYSVILYRYIRVIFNELLDFEPSAPLRVSALLQLVESGPLSTKNHRQSLMKQVSSYCM